MSQFACRSTPASRVAFYGQSLNLLPLDTNWDAGGFAGLLGEYTLGGTGTTWTMACSNLATGWAGLDSLGHLDIMLGQAFGTDVNGVVCLGGQTDLDNETSGEDTYLLLADHAAQAVAAGYDFVIACTVPPALAIVAAETERVAYNAAILADTEDAFSAKVDIGAIPELQNTSDLRYFSDGSHWTPEGARLGADLLRPVLLELLDA